ncbi:hypothetical protein [Rhizomonospora bruguierae]|uniref:hypothetical protein n=1 Tax=Rhizomonospora bruguierae TaxID=1581705 RepID=UPI001BCE7861|nr:hypothetical protein [Micromonospora sp. NBRC 107566]
MPTTDDYFRNAVITATSPDKCINARISNYTDVEIWFRQGTFERYDESDLAHQLGRLGQGAWVGYQRARQMAYRKALELGPDEADAPRPPEDSRRRAYDAALNEVQGEGVSTDGSIRIRTTGMLRWSVELERNAPRRLGEKAFLTQLGSAYRALLADRELKIAVLRSEHFDMGIPRKWLETMKRLQELNKRRM